MATEHLHGFPFGHLETAGPIMVWVIVLAFVFIECAFIIGLFLPGDSLLFTAGVVLSHRNGELNAWALAGAAVVVAVVGNLLGYYIGRQAGTSLLGRRSARVLTPDRMARAQDFLDRHGWWSVFLARWIPWIRTLAPLIAGAARMNPRRYLLSTAAGALVWVPSLVLAGYYGAGLLDEFPWVKTAATLGSIVFFVLGTGYGLYRYRLAIRGERPAPTPAPTPAKRRPAEATTD